MGQLPGAGAGEGVACSDGKRVIAATQGDPSLGVVMSREWKVGKGANLGPIGGDQLHSTADTATGVSARYKDHCQQIHLILRLWVIKMLK